MPPKSKNDPVPPGNLDITDIDLSAAMPALPPGPPPHEPKRGRGRPRSATPPPPRKYKIRKDKGVKRKPEPTQPPPAPIYINIGGSIDNSNIGEPPAVNDLKSKMTEKELKFIEIYLSGSETLETAMIKAGYSDYQKSSLNTIARRIVHKHEAQAGDHRIIFRAMGAGEVAVVQGLLKLAQGSKNDMVRLNAWSMIAKCIGLTKDQVEGSQGITIIFEGSPGQTNQVAVAHPAQEQASTLPTLPYAGRVLQITK